VSRGGFGGWISDDAIVISGRDSLRSREDVLTAVSLATGAKTELARVERLRGAALSPGGTWVAYYVAFNDNKTLNGLWVVKTDGTARRQLSRDLFGSYRWRDDGRLLIVPFRPGAESHQIVEFDAATGETRPLTDPSALKFKITNNDWTVSPDGRKVAFVNNDDYNIWLLTLMD
jgi:Tol biopolymer transport system component